MKNVASKPATIQNSLIVALTAKKMVPCNTLAEASAIVREYTNRTMPGMRRWSGGAVFHPTKKQIALISYNGRIWLKGLHEKGREMTSFFNGEPWGKACSPEFSELTTDNL